MKRFVGSMAMAAALAGCAQAGPQAPGAPLATEAGGATALAVALADGDQARFRQADRNGDGRLSEAELPLWAGAAFKGLDANGDGTLSFIEATANAASATERAREASAFKLAASAVEPGLSLNLAERIATGEAGARQAVTQATGNPVIFVPGYLDLEIYFGLINKRLREQGRDTTYLSLFPNVADIRQQAAALDRLVREVKARTKARHVDIVAHSMGGLISRYYIKELGGAKAVERLVMLATPNHGTIVSKLSPTKGAQQMHPGSDFLNALNAGDESFGPVKYTSLRGGLDEIVIPHDSPILEGAENHLSRLAAHGSIMVDPLTWKHLNAALKR